MSKFIHFAEKEKNRLEHIADMLRNSMINSPEGTLIIERHRNRVEYYKRLPDGAGCRNKRVYISKKNISMARALAQKDYNIRTLKILDASINSLENLISCYPEQDISDVYLKLDPDRKELVEPVVLTDKKFIEQWYNKPYTAKPFKSGDKFYYTEHGERVRSKSEVIIANALYHADVPYKYECPIYIAGNVVYPDFTFMDIRIRREKYFEHFGMMDNPEYLVSFMKKLELYKKNGILPGRDLICTFESSSNPLDTRLLKIIINSCIKGT